MTDPILPAGEIEAQAVLWLVRTGDPAFADWPAFEQWLGANAAHADAYHRAASTEVDMVDLLAASAPQAVVAPSERPRWRPAPWLGGAVAAALLIVVGYGALRPAGPILFETGPGQHRDVVLADGTRIALNGDTRLTVAAGDPRAIRMEQGEALFSVRHDPAHPFAVTVAGDTIADVGTAFDVVRDAGTTRIAVAQGTVMWNPTGEAVRLDAGHALRSEDGDAKLELSAIDGATVGGWARGQMSYEGTPLTIVAADVSRALGVKITVSPGQESHVVRGIVRLDGGADSVLPRLAALLGLRAQRVGTGWRLSSPP